MIATTDAGNFVPSADPFSYLRAIFGDEVSATRLENGRQLPLNNFSYLQSWYMPGSGFFNLFTHYQKDVIPGYPGKLRRTISYMTSMDGTRWSEWHDLAAIEEGHYQTSGMSGKKIATSFNFHPYKGEEPVFNHPGFAAQNHPS